MLHRFALDARNVSMRKNGPHDRLSDLGTSETAAIVSIETSRTSAKRLADMGFVRGAIVEMIRTGRPCLVRVGLTCVGLGFEHQGSIVVRRA